MSQKDGNVRKAVRMARQATDLTRSNAIGPRVGKKEKRVKQGKTPPQPGVRGPTLQAIGTKKSVLHDALIRWAQGLEQPFTGSPQRCPFNFNPTPSYLSFVATTVAGRFGFDSVATNSAHQWVFWPGHGVLNSNYASDAAATVENVVYDFDEVAYHAPFFKAGGDPLAVAVGPVTYVDVTGAAHNPCGSVISTGLALNSAQNDLSGGASTSVGWNTPLPMTGDVRLEGHLRYKMLSMGVKFINTTPELSRGGSFVSFQPVTVCDILTPQSKNAVHPSFKDWGPEGCSISWIPRLRDLSYWHPSAGAVLTSGVATGPIVTNTATGAGIVVFINNPTGGVQNYDVEIVAHWEISGYSVQSLSSQGKSTYVSDSVLKGALASQTNNAPTAAGFTSTLREAAGEGVHLVGEALGKVAQMAPRMAREALK